MMSSKGASGDRRREPLCGPDVSDGELLGAVVGFYAGTLAGSREALGWLGDRGVSVEAAGVFGVGFSDRSLGTRIPERNRRAGKVLRGRLQELGVLRVSGHEHLRGCVTVPVCDEAGVVRQVVGYRIGRAREPRGVEAVLALDGLTAAVWNPAALAAGEVLVAGSVLDGLVWWSAGFANVVAAAGDDDPVGVLAGALVEARTPRVLLAHPRPHGDEHAGALADRLAGEGVACFRVLLPRGVDATVVAAEADDPVMALGGLVRAATWMGDGPAPARTPGSEPTALTEPVPEASVSPLPSVPVDPDVEVVGGELRMCVGGRRWRVRGLDHVSRVDALRVNVAVFAQDPHLGEQFHLDTLDLYTARARAAFVHAAADVVRVSEAVLRRDLGRLLVACEQHLAAAAEATAPERTQVVLTAAEETAALELLGDPNLADRIVADVERVGVVGEATNVLVAYLAAVSRKLDTPLAVLVQSTSAAGKSSLMEAVLGLVPAEDRVSFSAVTGQSLFYMGEHELAHKVLSVAEEHGAARAVYALKLLQSEGELSIASTGKDAGSGRLVTKTYRVAGPVALFLTTTAVDVDEELANRCIVLSVDEHRDQTRAIHDAQRSRQTLDGLLGDVERERVVKLHRDAQRLLEPVAVVNPFAPQLGFPDRRTRTRRDHVKYLTLIRAAALLHQHQRPRRTARRAGVEVTYIEAAPADIALANRLAHDVLGRSLDELAPQTRRLLGELHAMVTGLAAEAGVEACDVRFSRRELRERIGWSDHQVRTHLGRLAELEYVLVHRGGRGLSFVYELVWDGGGTDGTPHLAGLVDPATLTACGYDPDLAGSNGHLAGGSWGDRGPNAPTSHPAP